MRKEAMNKEDRRKMKDGKNEDLEEGVRKENEEVEEEGEEEEEAKKNGRNE